MLQQYEDRPINRVDLGKKALVLPALDFRELEYISILMDRKERKLFAEHFGEDGDLIIFPEELDEG